MVIAPLEPEDPEGPDGGASGVDVQARRASSGSTQGCGLTRALVCSLRGGWRGIRQEGSVASGRKSKRRHLTSGQSVVDQRRLASQVGERGESAVRSVKSALVECMFSTFIRHCYLRFR
jgi:hypothetical protein